MTNDEPRDLQSLGGLMTEVRSRHIRKYIVKDDRTGVTYGVVEAENPRDAVGLYVERERINAMNSYRDAMELAKYWKSRLEVVEKTDLVADLE